MERTNPYASIGLDLTQVQLTRQLVDQDASAYFEYAAQRMEMLKRNLVTILAEGNDTYAGFTSIMEGITASLNALLDRDLERPLVRTDDRGRLWVLEVDGHGDWWVQLFSDANLITFTAYKSERYSDYEDARTIFYANMHDFGE